jgi:hypothetical protein
MSPMSPMSLLVPLVLLLAAIASVPGVSGSFVGCLKQHRTAFGCTINAAGPSAGQRQNIRTSPREPAHTSNRACMRAHAHARLVTPTFRLTSTLAHVHIYALHYRELSVLDEQPDDDSCSVHWVRGDD